MGKMREVTEALSIAVVISDYYQDIAESLLRGAVGVLESRGIRESVSIVSCPGAFEIPLAAQELARTGDYDAVICLGCLIRGETLHFEAIAQAVTHGLMRVGLDSSIPVAFGVLTAETYMQALERASITSGDKGGEAARAALQMVDQITRLRSAP